MRVPDCYRDRPHRASWRLYALCDAASHCLAAETGSIRIDGLRAAARNHVLRHPSLLCTKQLAARLHFQNGNEVGSINQGFVLIAFLIGKLVLVAEFREVSNALLDIGGELQ